MGTAGRGLVSIGIIRTVIVMPTYDPVMKSSLKLSPQELVFRNLLN